MKINKKGFTLVEIIVCVAIIAVVAVVIGVNSEKIFGKDNTKEDVKTTIISAAKVFTEGDRGLVSPLYDDKGFVQLTVGELMENGLLEDSLKDENGDVISEDTKILVTLNSDGYLEFEVGVDTTKGYLDTNDTDGKHIRIAATDPYSCDYLVNEVGGLVFNASDGTRITVDDSNLKNSEQEVTSDGDYYCNISTLRNASGALDVGEHSVTYTYQIDGLKRNKTRKIQVVNSLNYTALTNSNISNSDSDEKYYFDATARILYKKSSSSETYNINDLETNYKDYVNSVNNYDKIQLVYGIQKTGGTETKQISNDFTGLSAGNYTFKIYPVKKYRIYTDEELLNGTAQLLSPTTFSLEVKNQGAPTITAVTYKNASGTQIYASTSASERYVSVTTNTPILDKVQYRFTTTGSWSTLTNNQKLNTPSQYLYLKAIDKLGQSSSIKEESFNVSKPLTEFTDNKCTSDGTDTCYYKGSQSYNYVSYAGKTWRLYKITNKDWNLILNTNYKNDNEVETFYYGQIGKCTSSCCNGGRYYYRYLGDTDYASNSTNYTSYGYKGATMNNTLNTFYNSLSNTTLLKSFSVTPTSSYTTKSVTVGLLEREDYMKVAKCSTDSSCSYPSTNYIKSGKSEFWLLEYYNNKVGSGTYNYGYNEAYVHNYSVNSNGYIIYTEGSLSEDGATSIENDTLAVRPTVRINSEIAKIISGNGSSSNPYTLGS